MIIIKEKDEKGTLILYRTFNQRDNMYDKKMFYNIILWYLAFILACKNVIHRKLSVLMFSVSHI